MDWLQAVVLGIVQGLTEFLPVSSTAHVFVISSVFGWGDPGAAFSAVIQIGTELAVVIYFRNDIAQVFGDLKKAITQSEFRKTAQAKSSFALILGSVPILVIGFMLRNLIETDVRNLYLVAAMLILFGIVLLIVERVAQVRVNQELTYRSGLMIGFSQALALIPGVSRSGATISAGLALGYTRSQSTRFAFLLAIPAVFASGLFELRHGINGNFDWTMTLISTCVSFVVGLAVIHWFLKFIAKYSFKVFGWYRIIIGIIILSALSVGAFA